MTSTPELHYLRQLGAHQAHVLGTVFHSRKLLDLSLSATKRFDTSAVVSNVNDLAFETVENRYLLTGQADASISVYDTYPRPGVQLYSPCLHLPRGSQGLHAYGVVSVCWYPVDTGAFFTAGMDKLVKVWDTNEAKVAEEIGFESQINQLHASACARAHNLLGVALADGRVQLLDLLSGSATHSLKGHVKAVSCVRWSNRSEFVLASAGYDGCIFLWDIRSSNRRLAALDQYNGRPQEGAPTVAPTGHSAAVSGIEFSPDGQFLLSLGDDKRARLWSVGLGNRCQAAHYGVLGNRPLRRLQPAISAGTSPAIAFLPHDSAIAACDLETGERLRTLVGHYSQVTACCLSPLQQELYSVGLDRNLLLWRPAEASAAAGRATEASVFARTAADQDDWSDDAASDLAAA